MIRSSDLMLRNRALYCLSYRVTMQEKENFFEWMAQTGDKTKI